MIAAQVGKNRRIKNHTIYPTLLQPMRGHFHGDTHGSRRTHLCQQAVQGNRIRGGVAGFLQLAIQTIAERACYTCWCVLIQRLRNKLAARGLAIGAGNAHHK